MLKAIIFDCDGVIADTEPLHLAAFQRVLEEEGIKLTIEEYYREYLALDDRACFAKVFSDRNKDLSQDRLSELMGRKASHLEPAMREDLKLFPGVVELATAAASRHSLAVASGALRHEVELILEYGGLRRCFKSIVAAEDVTRGKPDPEPFLMALDQINRLTAGDVQPAQCLVLEDSIHGIEAAHQAGMTCLAVTNSYSAEQLFKADMVVDSLVHISVDGLEAFFSRDPLL